MTVFECAKVQMPLCYDGVCESKAKIDVFVKRQLARKADVAKKAVILLQGGPGLSSINLESAFKSLKNLLDDAVDVYTFDQRGTGRSGLLECDAAQAATAGSPNGTYISADELQTCLEDINVQYDGQAAAFSTTSAAMDVRTLINTFMAEQRVYIAGYSFGTFVTQRVLQLHVPQVAGYIFDGVDVLSRKGDAVESANSHWNKATQASGRRLLEFCFDDPKCPIKFKSRETVVADALAVLAELDKSATTNECAKIIVESTGVEVDDFQNRNKGLEALGLVQNCSKESAEALCGLLASDENEEGEKEDGSGGEEEDEKKHDNVPDPLDEVGQVLYTLIVSSERWAQPAPTKEERTKFFQDTVFATEDDAQAIHYCVYTGSTEPACEELKEELPKDRSATFFYRRDKYYAEPLTLPDHVSALIINGGLDFATPMEFGELLYSKLKGSGKGVMMVIFDYGTHCGGEAVAESTETPCHDAIMAAFIRNDGVDNIDTSCMNNLPKATFGPSDKKERNTHTS